MTITEKEIEESAKFMAWLHDCASTYIASYTEMMIRFGIRASRIEYWLDFGINQGYITKDTLSNGHSCYRPTDKLYKAIANDVL